ncbi:chemotaxis protein CheC [Rubeoparvulum massiliense]|uniref:chemotaxis protein CheC n=1 Tax=Rubeoparvulum massiliense TaxID=1631346 RepID=UPI001E49CB87|nr:chemotaxis protein CheC [Rubeoparvulum massiliense]
MNTLEQLSDFHLDVLREVGNIGAGHAATALSTLLQKPIDMEVPLVQVLHFDELVDHIGGAETLVVSVFLRIEGEIPGSMYFVQDLESAKKLLRNFAGITNDNQEMFNEMELSALQEIGNILSGSYLNSLSDFTSMRLLPTVPALAIDMAGAILDIGLIELGRVSDTAILIETRFFDEHEEIEGHFFLIPDPESFSNLFRGLGVSMP